MGTIFRTLSTAMLLVGGFLANTVLAQTPSNCPVYANPQCQVDYRLTTVDVPEQFRVAGCPTTMPLCVRSPESDEQAKRPSNRCGSQQKFNQTTGRCENTNSACRPFLRLCQRGESANTLCSCSPTQASDQGTAACVPALACPDNRVLNCEATYMASTKSCTVMISPTIPTSPTVTMVSDTTLLKQLEQCLLEYKTEMEKLRERIYGAWAKSSTSVAIPPSILQSQPWYNPWLQRCRDIMPGFNEGRTDGRDVGGSGGEGGGNAMSTETAPDPETDTDTDSESDSDGEGDGEGDGDGDGGGNGGGDE